MKYLLYLLAAMLALTSCGDFYELGQEPDSWDGVSMKTLNDSSFVMIGDSMPLRVAFLPHTPQDSAIYWMSSTPEKAMVKNDTLLANAEGIVKLVAISSNGQLTDTCAVRVIPRWNADGLNRYYPYDLVIYADIRINGQIWDDTKCMVGVFAFGNLIGLAEKHSDFGIDYAVLRIWANTMDIMKYATIECYDRENFTLYIFKKNVDFGGRYTLGTLSALYPIDFTEKMDF
ncbi:MAG: Ig domain-containing protein [Prevotella sp.]